MLAYDDDGKPTPFKAADYQLFWVHQLSSSTPNPATAAAALMPGLVEQAAEIAAGIEDGSGMLLTGLAPLYALFLQRADGTPLETVEPDARRENRYFIDCESAPGDVPGCVGRNWEQYPEYRALNDADYPRMEFAVGLALATTDHPIFKGLPEFDEWVPPVAGAFWTNENFGDVLAIPPSLNLVAECAWKQADQPGRQPKGDLLAHLLVGDSPQAPPRVLTNYAAVVEYIHGKGKVVSCGALACDLTPNGVYIDFQELRERVRTVMLEVLEYLSSPISGGPPHRSVMR